jgi:5'(3')-deoxyribonucleotidase
MTIYVDMDGVIADFFKELASHYGVKHWKDLPNRDESIKALKGTDFFGRIPKFETSDELIAFVDDVTDGEWSILSSPLRDDHENSSFWKRQWLDKHGYNPQEAIFTGRKEKYATTNGVPNILIDDKPENIERWVNKGGIGIRYQANENSLNDLKVDLLSKYVKTRD